MREAGLAVIAAGPCTLVQDGGRFGHFRAGVAEGGPADRLSFLWANRLCGNPLDAQALEILGGGLVVEARGRLQVAVTGPPAPLALDDRPVPLWQSLDLPPGGRLAVGVARAGMRLYLAVRGGFRLPQVLGSAATVVREGLGGLSGRPLRAGDFLPASESGPAPVFYLPPERRPPLSAAPLRVVAGWQYRDLPRTLRRAFCRATFRLSPQGDRQGLRLIGSALEGREALPRAMISEGALAGAVQIPPDGLPIILGPDHQTMGGYPKIGTLVACDLWRLYQLRPGTPVRFALLSAVRGAALTRAALRRFEATEPLRLR